MEEKNRIKKGQIILEILLAILIVSGVIILSTVSFKNIFQSQAKSSNRLEANYLAIQTMELIYNKNINDPSFFEYLNNGTDKCIQFTQEGLIDGYDSIKDDCSGGTSNFLGKISVTEINTDELEVGVQIIWSEQGENKNLSLATRIIRMESL